MLTPAPLLELDMYELLEEKREAGAEEKGEVCCFAKPPSLYPLSSLRTVVLQDRRRGFLPPPPASSFSLSFRPPNKAAISILALSLSSYIIPSLRC